MTDQTFQRLVDDTLAQKQSHRSLPPVDQWNPPLSGKMDLRIARDGTWYHEGTAFQRQALVKLFASILKREGDDYFLLTPVEKWQIEVEDVPFLALEMDIVSKDGKQALLFTTNTGETILACDGNPVRVDIDSETGEPSPYILVRSNLEARINRSIYYQLVEIATKQVNANKSCYVVESMGTEFVIG